jgi:hypothetical protein
MGTVIKTADRAATRHWHNRWTPEQKRGWCEYFRHNKMGQIARDEARRAARNKKRREAAKAKRGMHGRTK